MNIYRASNIGINMYGGSNVSMNMYRASHVCMNINAASNMCMKMHGAYNRCMNIDRASDICISTLQPLIIYDFHDLVSGLSTCLTPEAQNGTDLSCRLYYYNYAFGVGVDPTLPYCSMRKQQVNDLPFRQCK